MTGRSVPFDPKAAKRAKAVADQGAVVEETNRDHALVLAGNKVPVIKETVSEVGRFQARFITPDRFYNLWRGFEI